MVSNCSLPVIVIQAKVPNTKKGGWGAGGCGGGWGGGGSISREKSMGVLNSMQTTNEDSHADFSNLLMLCLHLVSRTSYRVIHYIKKKWHARMEPEPSS